MRVRNLSLVSLLGLIMIAVGISVNCESEYTTEDYTVVEKSIDRVDIEEDSYTPDEDDVLAITRTLYGECRGVPSTMEKAAVVWVILNRVDAGYGDSALEVVSSPNQFVGYSSSHPIIDELKLLTIDVMKRWHREKLGQIDVGRVLPPDYLWFSGDGTNNYFRNQFLGGDYWDWSLKNIYDN